jgi:hypothetical protein
LIVDSLAEKKVESALDVTVADISTVTIYALAFLVCVMRLHPFKDAPLGFVESAPVVHVRATDGLAKDVHVLASLRAVSIASAIT